MLDVLIIGSGPAGLSAAIYAKRGNAKVMLAEKEYLGTGQIAESEQVDNYLGMVGTSGYDLGEKFRQDAETLGVTFYEGEAECIEKTEDGWKVSFDNGEEFLTKTVIYSGGAIHRPLGLPEEERFRGKGVSYCAICDGAFYKGKTVVVVGGGDTALDDALYLAGFCEKVYLVHRRDTFRGAANTLTALKEKENVEILTDSQITKIEGETKVERVVINGEKTLEVNGVFVAVGMIPQSALLQNIVDLDDGGYVVAGEDCATSAAGIFAAGDVRTKPLRQVVTAVSDGANAAVAALELLKGQ